MNEKILLLGSDTNSFRDIAGVLGLKGYHLDFAGEADEVRRILGSMHPPDLLIYDSDARFDLDLSSVPELATLSTPVLVLTDDFDPDAYPLVPERLCHGYVRKGPGQNAFLTASVRTALYRSRDDRLSSEDGETWSFFFDNIPVAAIVSDRSYVIQQWNKSAVELFGYTREEAVGRVLTSLITSEKNEFSGDQLKTTLLNTLRLDEKSRNTNYDRTKDGRDIICQWLDLPFSRDGRGFIFSVAVDITREQELLSSLHHALEQKDFLMQEIYHRLKNNLSMIISLINLKADELDAQRARVQAPEVRAPEVRAPEVQTSGLDSVAEERLPGEALQDISRKISTFSVLYDMLYQLGGYADRVRLGEYLKELFAAVFSSMSGVEIRLSFDFQPVEVTPQTAITLGLISNEIATNALKYGFPRGEEGHAFSCALAVTPPPPAGLSPSESASPICEYTLANTGNPFPEVVDLKTHSTLGLLLINSLVAQLGGEVELEKTPSARYTIRFPLEDSSSGR